MSDIIKDAKQLLDGSTPAPWEWVGYSIESERGMVLDFQCVTEFGTPGASRAVEVTPEDEQLIAVAPELAQALAEETWEYAAAWDETKGMHTSFWHSQREYAEVDMHQMGKSGAPNPRIVRRRVSPPEVIND